MSRLAFAMLVCAALLTACAREPREVDMAVASGGIYGNCAACHGAQGQGGSGPAFRGNSRIADADYAIRFVLSGSHTMPAFAAALTDEQIARVVTTIRSQSGNPPASVTAGQVAAQRKALEAPAADSAARY